MTKNVSDFAKVLHLGHVHDWEKRAVPLFVKVEYKGGRLSITGVVGPMKNGDARGSCGQIVDHIDEIVTFAPGWSDADAELFAKVWRRWHLNDMRAGSSAQEDWLRANPVTAVYPESHYEKACQALAAVGLHPDQDGHKHGPQRKTESVPEEVLSYLMSRPESTLIPAWV